jgi:hypothetical protein
MRIHQYTRCVDGLILPDVGNTKRQFKSRTELFIGPSHDDLMGDIYDIRSAVEHLHANRYLETFDREARLDLLRKEAIVENMARRLLANIIDRPSLWPYFANVTTPAGFWSLVGSERRALWGDPIDAEEPLADFDPRFISDDMLGKGED